jgi:chemotaxis protein CheX
MVLFIMQRNTETADMYNDIVEGTKDVFNTMLMIELQAGEPVVNGVIDSNLSSILGLGGDIKGLLGIHCPEQTAKRITGELLGIEVETMDDDVNDAIGEIANMIAGNLKIAFEKNGINTQLAIPTTVTGKSYKTSRPQQAYCITVPFSLDDSDFWVELKYVVINS